MAKKIIEDKPTITLPDCIRELGFINVNLFQLKQGVSHLITMIENGNKNEDLKRVIEICKLKETLSNLTPSE